MGRHPVIALAATLALAFGTAAPAVAGDGQDLPVAAGTTDDPAAGTSLMGRTASFKALAYDDEALPLFDGLVHSTKVSERVEFGMGPEGVQNDLDVVPAAIDVSGHRIEISFALAPAAGWLVDSTFNGYLLAFEPDCLVIDAATVDRDWSTLAIDADDLILEGRTLRINLAGRYYDATSRLAVDLHVDDCPMS